MHQKTASGIKKIANQLRELRKLAEDNKVTGSSTETTMPIRSATGAAVKDGKFIRTDPNTPTYFELIRGGSKLPEEAYPRAEDALSESQKAIPGKNIIPVGWPELERIRAAQVGRVAKLIAKDNPDEYSYWYKPWTWNRQSKSDFEKKVGDELTHRARIKANNVILRDRSFEGGMSPARLKDWVRDIIGLSDYFQDPVRRPKNGLSEKVNDSITEYSGDIASRKGLGLSRNQMV